MYPHPWRARQARSRVARRMLWTGIGSRALYQRALYDFPRKTSLRTMSDPKELKNTGLKVTVPRLKVLDLFQHSPDRHLTAEDVYRKLLEEHSDVGLATVYRVLTQFEQAGLLVRHHFEGGKAVYEL